MNILRLKEVLKKKGVSCKELVEKVKISTTSISQIITENQQPRFDLLLQIAKTLNIDIKDLFNSTKEDKTTIELLNDIRLKLDEVEGKLSKE